MSCVPVTAATPQDIPAQQTAGGLDVSLEQVEAEHSPWAVHVRYRIHR